MPLSKPTETERRALLSTALASLGDVERIKLFDVLDALFESVLTDSELLHEDVDNPVEHHTTVLQYMMKIAKGEGFSWDEIRRAAAIPILHDIQPAPKVTRAMREAAKTPEEKAELELRNLRNRIIHMGLGSYKAVEKLKAVNEKCDQPFFTDEDIKLICAAIAVHDIPSINIPIPANARMAVAFREADRLWMQTRPGVRADLARKCNKSPTEQQCVEQASKNLDSYRKERALYNAEVEHFRDAKTFFRTKSGHRIFRRLRREWEGTAIGVIRGESPAKAPFRILETIQVGEKRLSDYIDIVGEGTVEEIRLIAKPLRDARVLHVNATAFGGGVAEMLYTLVPLMRDVGLNAEWHIIEGTDEFFDVTKAFHNGLQGMGLSLTKEMKDIWRRYNESNAAAFHGEYDFVIVHDPQPAGMKAMRDGRCGKHWIWRCHIDTSTPNPAFWDFIAPYLEVYDAGIFTMEQYVARGLQLPHLALITPTIDPLSPKNAPMPLEHAQEIVAGHEICLNRPLITQVSRYDPWKDPLGVIDAYFMVKKQIPSAQLALVGSMASDDPEGWDYLDKTIRHAGEDFDIHILHNFHGVGALEVGAFQMVSDVVIQKSTREGFGLVVTEALWKGKPVVGGNVGGIPLQVIDGETGFLVDSVEACGEKTLYLLQHPEESRRMGERAREHVRDNFLTTHHLKDYLQLFLRLS